MSTHGLGRLVAPDHRDSNYLLSSPRIPVTRLWRNWYDIGWIGDQGATPTCVGFAWSHYLEASPTTHPAPGPHIDPMVIYRQAQLLDEWAGQEYEGTSVRAGAKYLQSIGVIYEYRWAFNIDTVCRNLLEVGPVVLGVNWYDGFTEPDAKGMIHLDGPVVGGHAILATGYHKLRKRVRLRNSWGREWGVKGHCWISESDLGILIAQDGEACMAAER